MSTELQRVIVSDTFLKYVSLVLRSELWIEYYISQLLIRKVGLASVSQPMVLNSVIRLKRHLEPELMRSLKDSNNTSVKDRKTSIKKSHCFFFALFPFSPGCNTYSDTQNIYTHTHASPIHPPSCVTGFSLGCSQRVPHVSVSKFATVSGLAVRQETERIKEAVTLLFLITHPDILTCSYRDACSDIFC